MSNLNLLRYVIKLVTGYLSVEALFLCKSKNTEMVGCIFVTLLGAASTAKEFKGHSVITFCHMHLLYQNHGSF
jgi:hypothetical protein